MKRIILTTIVFCAFLGIANAQNSYWVFFTDKQNTTFDPYQYFDTKAIERYAVNGADLYDITNYPVNGEYASAVENASEELIGTSRWLNAAGVMATEEQIAVIRQFPFVAGIQLIASNMEIVSEPESKLEEEVWAKNYSDQIDIHQGEQFKQHNITGKGVRIAVFDAGFPDVNTHPAFKHMRDNNQIIKTWNFAKKKENVYLANSHGRMVLSCIGGKINDTTCLGMAPDAQYLLARTEINTEPLKEEVWWVQALEWADQNGADIVNSSLGYGKQRYQVKQMNGTSMVARAANTAARKGILVCNAMGNEGDDKEWKMLITPADADSILSVGGVYSINQLTDFSSFGPTADGRMKPNVVAMGHCWVAGEKGNFTQAYGTSFSSPMTAGFAACVKQLHPEYTAWQLKTEIEKSGNHYPYFDYAYGYGVPQAGYFFGEKPEVKNNVSLSEDEDAVYVTGKEPTTVFYKITNGDGTIDFYNQKDINENNGAIRFSKDRLQSGQTLEIWSNGQILKYAVGQKSLPKVDSLTAQNANYFSCAKTVSIPDNDIYTRKYKTTYKFSTVLNFSFMLPSMWSPNGNIWTCDRISHGLTFAFDNSWRLARPYALGFRIGFGSSWYAAESPTFVNPLDAYPTEMMDIKVVKNNIKVTKFDLELVNRFILGYAGKEWWYIDAGIFGEWNTGSRYKIRTQSVDEINTHIIKRYLNDGKYGFTMNRLDYGVRLRVGITRRFAIYGQYRISNLLKVKGTNTSDFPKWEIGIQLF
jgi:subtilisin family serine protease